MTLEEFYAHPAWRELLALTGERVKNAPTPEQIEVIKGMTGEELARNALRALELATRPKK